MTASGKRSALRSTSALAALTLVGGLLTGGAVMALAPATPAAAAVAPSQQWVTDVSPVTGTGVGASRTLTFDSGVTATEQTTDVTGTCVMFGSGSAGVNTVPEFLEPDAPAAARSADNNCAGPHLGGGSRTSTVEFSTPVIAPVIHVTNLDASRLDVTGDFSLTELAKNNAMEVSGNTLNAVLQPALNVGCAGNDGSNPNGACGSFRLTSADPISSFNLVNDTTGSTLPQIGSNDSWGYTLSYPTAPLTKAFSPASVQVGVTSELTFTISNPDEPTQPTLTPLDFTDNLPSGLRVADGTATDNGSCGTPTITNGSGDPLAEGATTIAAGGISVAPGATCEITVNVTADAAGSYRNSTDNLESSVANLVPDADTTLTVTEVPAPNTFSCLPGAPGLLFQREPTDVYSVDLVTGAYEQTGTAIDARNINAVGYNPIDNYLYGIGYTGDPTIKRIGADGTTSDLGMPSNWTGFPGIPAAWTGTAHIGDFDAEGHLWISTSANWAEIDLSDPSSPTYMQVLAAGPVSMPAGLQIGWDWGFNVDDGDLYFVAMNAPATSPRQFSLVRFDTESHTSSVVGALGALQHPDGQFATAFGAVYSDPDGFLYGADNTTGGIWRIDMATAEAEFFAEGPASGLNDGARCFNSPLPIDFGDAPDSYGTTLANDGPRHSIPGYDPVTNTAPLMLGSLIDSETDGQPTPGADGDDNNGINDEDGVADPIRVVRVEPTTVTVSATNNTAEPATLAGWIDLDGNGTFDAAERVVLSVPASSGTADYQLVFPATAADVTETYARFRLFPGDIAAAAALPTGAASAGEVEDYPVTVVDAPLPAVCVPDQIRATERFWFFGQNGAIDFGTSGTTATAFLGNQTTMEGSTVVTDSAGDLQFWSNGQSVFDREGNPMPNGTGLLGNPSATQTVAAFPALGASGRYFVVTTSTDVGAGPNGDLRYSVVDMTARGGLGDVTDVKNVPLGAPGTASEAITAVPNADGTGFWVLTYTNNSPNILAYEFDADGPVSGEPVVSVMPSNNFNGYGSLAFSADYSRVVALSAGITSGAGGSAGTQPSIVRVLRFNAETGRFAQEMSWSLPTAQGSGGMGYNAEFSPDGRFVYATKIFGGGQLYRYDLQGATSGAEVKATERNVGSIGTTGGQIRRGPDGRMYVANNTATALSVVNAPNDAADPQLVTGGFPLPAGAASRFGLPQTVTGCPVPVEYDFGDAPDSYGTTRAADGARHIIVDGLRLGAEIDAEPDGQPTPGADGDDINGIDDEDAFSSRVVLNPGATSVTLTVPVTNTTGQPATLYGWIDSNGSGRFEASEFASVTVPDGATSVELPFVGIPATVDGTTPVIRLRLTSDVLVDDPATPDVDERALGAASDGEVEDHLAQVATSMPLSCATPFVETFGTGTGYGPELPTGQTGYTYVGAPKPSGMIDEDEYAIVSSPHLAHVNWHVGEDRTPGDTDGRMMVVNAADEPRLFFQRTFTGLAPGGTYNFSAWFANVLPLAGFIEPDVTFRVVDPASGRELASAETGPMPHTPTLQWSEYGLEFVATQQTVRLEMVNNVPGLAGNDLAIDDISFTPVCEFGDAPDSYGTTIAADGAAHIAVGPTLGVERDTEPDGQPSPGADGDDLNGTPNDEDGVAQPIVATQGRTTEVTVTATNDSDVDVTLAAWMDLDGNGTFEDGERVMVTVPAGTGTADYQVTFGEVQTGADTYARFRIYGGEVTDPSPT
ncbi:GEVED domain-containing protein, partial [Microbacterium album]|uniref:GEVED domain-containing protein n=1 Tax=Microbacterium album TaxID=2053191 RepID=UPI001E4D131B